MNRHATLVQSAFAWGESTPSAPQTNIVPLAFSNRTVRMIFIKGEPWWVASDVCRALEIVNASDAVKKRLDDDERGLAKIYTPSGEQEMLVVNEPGIYNLIFTSNKPEARAFKRWLTHEVLPEIRKTGTYSVRGKRIDREVKRLGVDEETAKIRCDQFALNKLVNRGLADEGACPNDFAAVHNAVYRGHCGDDAPGLRAKLGLRPWETPLDRMGILPLMITGHAKVIGSEKIRALGGNLPLEAKLQILETTAHELTMADLQRLGPGFRIDLKDDPRRGKVIDVVRNEIAAPLAGEG